MDKFSLHESCSKLPEMITHPSHHEHKLTLLPTCNYPSGVFQCNACTQPGTQFHYHCQICSHDLHVSCAFKPNSVNHPFHQHPLVLTFSSPYGGNIGFSCNVCHSLGSPDQWAYRCVPCRFDVHLNCATANMPPALQHSHSYSAAGSASHQPQFVSPGTRRPLAHSMSTGHAHASWQTQNPTPVGVQSYPHLTRPQTPASFQTYQGPPRPQPQLQPPAHVGGHNMVDVMVTGFVRATVQQLGHDFVHSFTGSGGNGGHVANVGGHVAHFNVEPTNTNGYECSNTNGYDCNTINDYECDYMNGGMENMMQDEMVDTDDDLY